MLASGCKAAKLAQARAALSIPAPNPQAVVAGVDVLLCPCCKTGRLHTVMPLPGLQRLPAPGQSVGPACRGPPRA